MMTLRPASVPIVSTARPAYLSTPFAQSMASSLEYLDEGAMHEAP